MSSRSEPFNLQYASLLSQPQHNEALNARTPTIFDVFAQENMHQLFRTAFEHVFTWVTSSFKDLKKLAKFRDWIYLAIHGCIELMYLKAYDALFSEYFYGMKRIGVNSNLKRLMSIVLSLVVPYLKAKFDEFYEEIEKISTEPVLVDETNLRKRINRLMLAFYPYFNLLWHGIFWIFRFRFLTGASQFHSPLLKLLNQKLVYDTNRDDETSDKGMINRILEKSNYIFTSCIYFIQFYQWYEDYNDNESYRTNTISLSKAMNSQSHVEANIIPPPKLPEKLSKSNAYKSIESAHLCPLCMKRKTNQSVLDVSGFVFCYPCVFKFVREHRRCPLTNYPCDTNNIVRIYDVPQ